MDGNLEIHASNSEIKTHLEPFMKNFIKFIDNIPAHHQLETCEALKGREEADDDIRSFVESLEGDDPSAEFDIGAPGLDLSLFQLDLDEEICPRTVVAGIATKAYEAPDGAFITVITNNRAAEKVLTRDNTKQIVITFFHEMMGTVLPRLQEIVKQADAYNAAFRGFNISKTDASAPTLVRHLYADLMELALHECNASLQYLKRNIQLVRLNAHWSKIRNALRDMGDTGKQIVRYLALEKRGATYVSAAKAALCAKIQVPSTKFGEYMRSSHIPAALTKSFGPGSLLFLPNNASGHRHRILYPSAAAEMFEIIARSDKHNFIKQASNLLNERVVAHISEKTPLAFDLGIASGINSDMSLLKAISLLEDPTANLEPVLAPGSESEGDGADESNIVFEVGEDGYLEEYDFVTE